MTTPDGEFFADYSTTDHAARYRSTAGTQAAMEPYPGQTSGAS